MTLNYSGISVSHVGLGGAVNPVNVLFFYKFHAFQPPPTKKRKKRKKRKKKAFIPSKFSFYSH